jgi:hypothetical protein
VYFLSQRPSSGEAGGFDRTPSGFADRQTRHYRSSPLATGRQGEERDRNILCSTEGSRPTEKRPCGAISFCHWSPASAARISGDSIRRYLRAADAIGRWLSDHGLSLHDANPSTVGRHVENLGRLVAPSTPNGRRAHKAIGLRHQLEVLQAQSVTSATDVGQSSGIERCLSEFDHHLDQVAGNAPRTRTNYMRYARRLLDRLFGSAEPDWSRLQADYIADFVRQEAARMWPSSCGQPVTAIRSLLRFLVATDRVWINFKMNLTRLSRSEISKKS